MSWPGPDMSVAPTREGVRATFFLTIKWRRCPTLPHPPECSTIGAGGLSFRVRNETGRFPTAIATAKNTE